MVDEPVTVARLRNMVSQANAYRSSHPDIGYPKTIRELSFASSEKLRCGIVVGSETEVCSIQSRQLPAEYVLTYRTSRSEKSNVNDRFTINADALSSPGIIGTRRHFRIDEAGVLRAEETRPADDKSPTP
jgi:hypothetical protein